MAAESYACMRASTADRERSLKVVKASFVEGRLTKEELDLRVGQVLVSRFFAELMALTADLPVGPFGRLPAHPVTPPFPRLSRLAIVALACAIAGPLSAGLTAVPAIVVGHRARLADPADRRAGHGRRRGGHGARLAHTAHRGPRRRVRYLTAPASSALPAWPCGLTALPDRARSRGRIA